MLAVRFHGKKTPARRAFRTCHTTYKRKPSPRAETRLKTKFPMERETEAKKKKELRLSSSDGNGGVSGGRSCWEGMNREILSLIFVRIPSDEVARSVAFVCRSWRDAVAEPYSWSHVDVEQWCRRCDEPEVIDHVVRKIVRRSRGTLCCLSAFKLSDFSFSFVAQSGQYLEVLKIPVSFVTDKMVTKHAESLSNLTVLDISYCLKITQKGLEAFGKNCKSLIKLRRNMPPPDFNYVRASEPREVVEHEAIAVANTMPGLVHLELGFGIFSDYGLGAILTKCKALCHLDIRGCWNVKMKGELEDRCDRIKNFRSPWDDEFDDATSSDSDFGGGNEA